MEKILYILENSITKKLENEIKNNKNCSVLTLDFELKKNLEKIGIKTIDEQDFLNFDDYEEIDNHTLNFSRNWFTGKKIENILEYNNINIGLMLQNELYQNIIKYVHRIKLIEKILYKINPEKVLTIFSNDIMGKIPQKVCLSNNFNTKIIPNYSNLKNKNKFDQVNFSIKILGKNKDIIISKKQFTYIKKIFEFYWDIRSNLMNSKINKSKSKGKSILFLDFNLMWHKSFLELLNGKNYKLMFLNNRRPIIWDFNSLNIAKQFPIIKINLPKIEKEIQKEYTELIHKFKKNICEIEMTAFFRFSNFDFWEIFKPELEKIIENRTKNIMILIKKMKKFLENEKIDVVWTLDDWGDDRIIVEICKQYKIPICNLLSGSMSVQKPDGRRWILPGLVGERFADKLCIWGENDKKNCEEANVNMEKIVIGGAPRYDKLFFKQKIDNDYILILTGGFPSTANSYFLSTSMILNFEKLLENTLMEVKKFRKKVIIKRHPTQGSTEIINLNKMFSRILPDAIILKDANTIELISKATLIISMQSTVVEESIILDKPIILLPYLKNDDGLPYVSCGAVIEVDKSEKIFQAIHDCLYDDSTKEKLKIGRKSFLDKVFSFQGSSSKKHLQVMEDLLNMKK